MSEVEGSILDSLKSPPFRSLTFLKAARDFVAYSSSLSKVLSLSNEDL